MHPTLTTRQARFVTEYLKDQNASAAAGLAGYTAHNLAAQGSELMKNPAIRDRVRVEMQHRLAEVRCTALELMKKRMRIAFFDIDQMCGPGWTLLPLEEMSPDTRQVLEVSTVLRKSGPVMRVKQPDWQKALRAQERAHEKLDQLNEKYCAQLEKAGKLRTLEEIEAMDGGAAGNATTGEIPQILSFCQVHTRQRRWHNRKWRKKIRFSQVPERRTPNWCRLQMPKNIRICQVRKSASATGRRDFLKNIR